MSTTLKTALTPQGYKTLMKSGLVNEIAYYNINDNYHNYLVSATENLVPGVVGSHNQITTSECAFAEYSGVFNTNPTPQEIESVTSKVQINFVNEECSYGNFNQPNLNMNININTWLSQLETTPYSFDMDGLTLDLWDYVTATKQTLNLNTKTFDDTKYLTNLGLTWSPKTEFDLKNMSMLSPRYVELIEGTTREMMDNSNVRYGSPFFLSFSTYSVNGQPVQNTAGRFSLVTNEFGYWVNGSEFETATTVETSDIDIYRTILPAAKVGNNIYTLNENVVYPTKAGFIGYALNMYKTDRSGETLLTGLINQAKLFMLTYGIYDNTNNIYTLPISLNVIVTNPDINSVSDKVGGNIRLNFIYNPNNNTDPIIQLL